MILTAQVLVDKARELMFRAHDGQFRADGVTPYRVHPEAALAHWLKRHPVGDYTYWLNGDPTPLIQDEWYRGQALCLSHDIAEPDAAHMMTVDELAAAGLESIKDELTLLTKHDGDSYLDYLLHLKRSHNHLAIGVKLADMAANLDDLHNLPSKAARKGLRTKYELGGWILRNAPYAADL